MTDYLKLAREAREWTFPFIGSARYIPALCDAIEAQAALLDEKQKCWGYATEQRLIQVAKVKEQAAEIERLKAQLVEAAEEIEQLNADLHYARDKRDVAHAHAEELKAEIERLRAQRDEFRDRLNKADMLNEGELDDD